MCEHIVHTPIHTPLTERGPAAFEVAYLLIPAYFMIGCGSRVILETILVLWFIIVAFYQLCSTLFTPRY